MRERSSSARRRLQTSPVRHAAAVLLIFLGVSSAAAQSPPLELHKGDRIVLLGNTMAERLQQYNNFETLLMARFPDLDLVVRNLGWSGDTIALQPRPLNFGDAAKHLREQEPDVILAFFGLNESFAGEAGLAPFERQLESYLKEQLGTKYSERGSARLALITPLAHEPIARLAGYVDVEARNRMLARYTETMRQVAARCHVTFVDLFTPTRSLMAQRHEPLTINGIHVNEAGDRVVAGLMMAGLGLQPGGAAAAAGPAPQLERLRELVREKNQQFFYRWRPVNAEYVVGRRLEPFGAVNFPPEMRQLDEIVAAGDQRIWAQARVIRDGTQGGGRP